MNYTWLLHDLKRVHRVYVTRLLLARLYCVTQTTNQRRESLPIRSISHVGQAVVAFLLNGQRQARQLQLALLSSRFNQKQYWILDLPLSKRTLYQPANTLITMGHKPTILSFSVKQ